MWKTCSVVFFTRSSHDHVLMIKIVTFKDSSVYRKKKNAFPELPFIWVYATLLVLHVLKTFLACINLKEEEASKTKKKE